MEEIECKECGFIILTIELLYTNEASIKTGVCPECGNEDCFNDISKVVA